ncbi:hypothetical protein A6E01_19140 (plasmid) [Vibrio breoganii]|uniref:TraG N-terminal Proteobacteria domain-containing protein n=1 Tax=Vibrio breoganii TaxID=553239 RepID=A0AAN1CU70_9VIBR|nr:hypothetical protein [Vibrio breoganii]ANO35330.1 hypothetical protein A6E01_19140 [Vibrio breoganii]
MVVVSDPTALVILPTAMTLAAAVFDLIAKLNLWLLPVIYVIIVESMKSRTMGADEGVAQLYAMKKIEKTLLWFFLVIFLFMIPVTSSQGTRLAGFACGPEISSFATPDNPIERSVSNPTVKLPVGYALVNNLSQAIGGSLSGMMPCGASSRIESTKVMEAIRMPDNHHTPELKVFAEKCYFNARRRLANAVDQDRVFASYDPTDVKAGLFFGQAMKRVYTGTFTNDGRRYEPLTFSVHRDAYTGPTTDFYIARHADDRLVNEHRVFCDAGSNYYRSIMHDMFSSELEREYKLVHNYRSAYPDRTGYYVTPTETKDYLSESILLNHSTVSGEFKEKFLKTVSELFVINPKETALDVSLERLKPTQMGDHVSEELLPVYDHHFLKEFVVTLGAALAGLKATLLEESFFAMVPVALVMLSAVVVVASPLMLVVSGYKMSVLLNTCAILFFAATAPYILNIGYAMGSTLQAIGDSVYGMSGTTYDAHGLVFQYMGAMTSIVIMFVWAGFCMMIGMNLGGFLNALLGEHVLGAGREAFNMGKKGLDVAAKAFKKN